LELNEELKQKAAPIKLLLLDVDGVLSDGKLYIVPGPNGTLFETKVFDSQDGIALRWLAWHGIRTGIISGRVSEAAAERARQVEMAHVYQGHVEKIPIYEEILQKEGISEAEVAYVGDDLTDAIVMHRVGLSVATANARPEVKHGADYTTIAAGGHGAVREVCELILRAKGLWEEILKKYKIPREAWQTAKG
jgi:3-deoxy-D-manno-octulosonate 8-phosphate phosphatase (KDO 8-P phosphatase)